MGDTALQEAGGVELSFSRWDVRGRKSIVGLFPPPRRRTGIYVLEFADGQRYVGQARDVTRRFREHAQTWDDIVAIQFARCALGRLDTSERATINALLQEEHVLRNIVDVPPGRVGPTDLDAVVPVEDQQSWFIAEGTVADPGVRHDDLQLRAAHHSRYLALETSGFLSVVSNVLRPYIQRLVPYPGRTERDFWAVSAMPSTGRTRLRQRLAALSINAVETAVVYRYEGETFAFINVSKSVFQDKGGRRAEEQLRSQGCLVAEATYRTGAGDMLAIDGTPEMIASLMSDPAVVAAAKYLNLNLMRRGRTFQWRWHNYDLADHLLTW